MKKIEAGAPEAQSADVVAGNVAQLKALFPEAFTEGKVNIDVLTQLLGAAVDDREEKYGLNWHGKRKARQLALTPSTGTLRPCPEESVDWDTTRNLMIEGDNLEVLKLLQKSYAGKVKLIYIDPPYNTGKDFVYPDDFRDNIKNYQELTGQLESGKKISSNTEASGRFHTDWLNMMYPRLKLARSLLADDGAICISIDENEIANLKLLLVDVFGEENVIGAVANINNPKGRSDDKFLATAHEYMMVALRQSDKAKIHGFEPEENVTKRYNKKDSLGKRYREIDLRKTGDEDLRIDRPDMFYYFYYNELHSRLRVSKERGAATSEIEIVPLREDGAEGRWRWGYDTAQRELGSLLARFMPNRKIWGVFEKDYLEGRPPVKSTTVWSFKDVNSERGSEQLMELGFSKETFPRPKPLGTMRRVLEIGTVPGCPSLVCDFFAGSGSFLHASMQLAAEDSRDLRYIGIQLPEPTRSKNADGSCTESPPWKEGFKAISDITKERLRRAGVQIRNQTENAEVDLGFRVYKLDTSNIQVWEPDRENIAQSLDQAAEHLKKDRTEQDVLCELLLKLGLDLTIPIEKKAISGKTVYSVGAGVLIACLDFNISAKDVEPIAHGIAAWHKKIGTAGETTIVFRDSAFANDVAKTNLTAILQQHGLDNVRSL